MRSDRYTPEQWATVDAFQKLYYGLTPSWLGIPVLKNAMDLVIYQEILASTRPELIVETGTAWGGSTLFFASICELVGCGAVVSIDNRGEEAIPTMYRDTFGPDATPPTHRPVHPRITYLTGDVLSRRIHREVNRLASGRRTMVVLDSTHTAAHILAECRLYAPLVTPGCYLSLEDVNPAAHGLHVLYNAVVAFLRAHLDFKWNIGWADRYLMTQNAYLIRQEATDESVRTHFD